MDPNRLGMLPEHSQTLLCHFLKNQRVFSEIIGKKYIPGQIEGSYMITEEAYTPHVFEIEMLGRKTFETRGKWEVKDMYMAGPFLSYSVVDKPNNRIVVVEGFTFAPSIKKRDYMFELEAILKTLKIEEESSTTLP